MMRLPMAMAFLLLAGSSAGCAGLGSEGPAVGSAREWQEVADRAAHKWADDARLLSADASELDDAARAELDQDLDEAREEIDQLRKDGQIPDEAEADIKAGFDLAQIVIDTHDPDVGDGKASLWGYVYSADSQPGELDFIAIARGKVVYHENDDGSPEEVGVEFGSLGNWSIDSDEAAAAARLGSEDYVAVCGMTNLVVGFSLHEGDAAPLWSVWAQAGGEDDNAAVAIDASTGSLIVDETIEPVVDVLRQELGGEDGTFTGGIQVTQGTAFDVFFTGHQQLVVQFLMFPAPPQPVTVTVTDPNGTATSFDVGMGQTPFATSDSITLTDVPNGEYQVSMSVPLALHSQWSLSWCTDGTPDNSAGYEPACDLVEQGSQQGRESPGSGRQAGCTPDSSCEPSFLQRWLGTGPLERGRSQP